MDKNSSLLQFGLKDNMSNIEEFRMMVVNVISLLTSIVLFVYLFIFIKTGNLRMSMLFLFFIGIAILSMYTNKLGYYLTSRFLILSTTIGLIFYIVLSVGFVAQSQVMLVILVACVPVLFNDYKIVLFFFLIIILLFFFSNQYLIVNGPLFKGVEIRYSHLINFSFAILSSTIFSIVITNKVRSYINQIEQTNELLQTNNKELTKQNSQIELQNKNLELFTTVASHDLKTPLRTISSFSGLIEMKLSKENSNDPKLMEYLQHIQTGTKQMSDLINSISTVNRLQYESSVERNSIDLNQIVTEVKFHFNKDLYPNFNINVGQLPSVKGVKNHFYNLFQNLIENSWKYNENEHKEIVISSKESSKHFTLIFKDNGIGIDSSYIDQIFQPFKKLHSNISYEGSGMGLAICKSIVGMYNGSIDVKSDKSNGSVFTINFPISIINTNNQ